MQGKLYVVGGRAASTGLNLRGDGEAYDPHADQWTMISPLRCVSGIGNAALTALDGMILISFLASYTVHTLLFFKISNMMSNEIMLLLKCRLWSK